MCVCVYICEFFGSVLYLLVLSIKFFYMQSQEENSIHPFGLVGFIVMMRKRIMGLRLNKGRAFYVSITALLLSPSDLFQASLLLCFH